MLNEVKIDTKGIKASLKKLKFSDSNFYRSIAEYIWNGFDAEATKVELMYEFTSGGNIKSLVIKDNGHGINHNELKNKFEPIFVSEKLEDDIVDRHSSTYHGKNGVGRFTFFTFANLATWTTIYNENNKNYQYAIKIFADKLERFSGIEEVPIETNESQGTTVEFLNFNRRKSSKKRNDANSIIKEMSDYLAKEFCWYIELKKSLGYKLLLNGEEIDYSSILEDSEIFDIIPKNTEVKFNIRYVRWSKFLDGEYSNFYYLDGNNQEQHKETTTLNNQSDGFFHSLFISSDYFIDFNFKSSEQSPQKNMTGGCRSDDIFKYLKTELEHFLRRKRKPFLKEHAKEIIKSFEDEGIITKKNKNDFELIQIDDLEEVVQGIYTTQPKIFFKLKREQKQILVGLLNIVLNSEERDQVIEIIDQIVKLDSGERKELGELLKVTNMTRIIKTMNLIKDRYKVLKILEEVLYNTELGADEVHHLQKIVENHYWIFGERYNLVAAAEDNFEKSLRNHIKILTDEDEDITLDHPDKLKQVDVFICRQEMGTDKVHNIIIELKHPKINIGMKQLNQIKKYMQTTLDIPLFNADNYTWDFILVGNKYDSTNYIEGELENNKSKGEPGLVYGIKNYKIYVRKWSDILIDCNLKHNFLNEKLELEKSKLVPVFKSPVEAVESAKNNSAVLPS
jgi:hypothetical protein